MFEWTEEGIIIEADQRHAELIVQDLGLNDKTKAVSTPGLKEKGNEEEEEELPSNLATMYRANVARGNYLTQDRSDIQFATKELSRKMSKPCNEDWQKLKRLARYLTDKTRSRTLFQYQELPSHLEIYVDTDFAGCSKTRKSTSGGVAKYGEHLFKTWVQRKAS